ncbi:DUF3299 domain-containing protein [Vibrio sp. WXL103]|uniref:DUF3299 domain-containing protein n=1 Tax=unclassified Vibrio TaxID=2614977 RepID=UPI003EC7E0FE
MASWDQLIEPGQRETLVAIMAEEKQRAREHDELDPFIQPQSVGFDAALVNQQLVDQELALGGFVVPLDWNDEAVTEFLLVPYFGACIHVPPPPANQMVHVKYPQGVPNILLRDAIVVEGELLVQRDEFGDGWQVTYAFNEPAVRAY